VYTESYLETQNYKYCFLNGRSGDGAPVTSGILDSVVEETDDQINDEVTVDAAFEDLSVTTVNESACRVTIRWPQWRLGKQTE